MEDDSDRPKKLVPKSPSPRPPAAPQKPPDEQETESTGSPAVSEPKSSLGSGAGQRTHSTPFHEHSLRGFSAKLKANAVDTAPLFDEVVRFGQATMIYAQANSGKTLTTIGWIIGAIDEGRLDPDALIYVNADDSSKGLAEKVELLEALGAHMVAPNHRGFKAADFVDKLKRGIQDGSARGSVVVIDTLKKFTNLMDKGRSSEFAQVCREYVMAGGTILALGHTAKSPNHDGTPRYQGTTDILEDFDAVYVAEPMSGGAGSGERVIRFTRLKARAEGPEVAAYAYSTREGLTYEEKVASLRTVYPEELDSAALEFALVNDQEVIDHIRSYLASGHGHVGQDKIVRVISKANDMARSQVLRVLNQYTGPDPDKHLWNYEKGARGKRTYFPVRSKI